jgi:hypothetical protein
MTDSIDYSTIVDTFSHLSQINSWLQTISLVPCLIQILE